MFVLEHNNDCYGLGAMTVSYACQSCWKAAFRLCFEARRDSMRYTESQLSIATMQRNSISSFLLHAVSDHCSAT